MCQQSNCKFVIVQFFFEAAFTTQGSRNFESG